MIICAPGSDMKCDIVSAIFLRLDELIFNSSLLLGFLVLDIIKILKLYRKPSVIAARLIAMDFHRIELILEQAGMRYFNNLHASDNRFVVCYV